MNNVKYIYEKKIEQLKKTCQLCNYGFTVLETKEEIIPFLDENIHSGMVCSVGGSMSLFECGVPEYLETRNDLTYLDRYHCDNTEELFRKVFSSDVYLTSTNALTMKGELYNVDATGNRVAAMIYGPKKVYVVCGLNKLVTTLEEAIERVKFLAAPANCVRLNRNNPCTMTGKCENCRTDTRLCNAAVTISHSRIEGRIHIVLVKENFGY